MNKKGYSLSGFSEAALGCILFILILGIIGSEMNSLYLKNNDLTFGINPSSTLKQYKAYQDTLQQGAQGEAETNVWTGVNLSTIWNLIKEGLNTTWQFITGRWIEKSIGLMQLGMAGTYLALILRILLFLAIGFILIKLLMKVKP